MTRSKNGKLILEWLPVYRGGEREGADNRQSQAVGGEPTKSPSAVACPVLSLMLVSGVTKLSPRQSAERWERHEC
jgi:hypothetical protein